MSLSRVTREIAAWAADYELPTPTVLFSRATAAAAAGRLRADGHGPLLLRPGPAAGVRVLRAYADLVEDFAVTGRDQLYAVLAAGVDPARVVLDHPVPSRDLLRAALRLDVGRFVVDDLRGLRMLRAEGGGRSVLLRLRPPDGPAACGATAPELRALAAAAVRGGDRVEALCCPDDDRVPAVSALADLHGALARDGIAVPRVHLGDTRFAGRVAGRVGPAVRLVGTAGPELVGASLALLTRVVADRVVAGRRLVHLDSSSRHGLLADDAVEAGPAPRVRLADGRPAPAYLADAVPGVRWPPLAEGAWVLVPGCGPGRRGTVDEDGARAPHVVDVPARLDRPWLPGARRPVAARPVSPV